MSKPVEGLKRKSVDLDCSLRGVKWKDSIPKHRDTAKAWNKGAFLALNAYSKKEGRSQVNNLTRPKTSGKTKKKKRSSQTKILPLQRFSICGLRSLENTYF